MLNPKPPPPFVAEVTVVSAEGLNTKPSSIFSLQRRLRPFVTLSTASPTPHHRTTGTGGNIQRHEYKTRVANDEGCANPSWVDVFRIPLDATFFPNRCFVYLHLFTERLLFGPSQLGWCQIPASDIGLPPVGSVRHLSYRLRKRDGSRSGAIINLAVKLEPQGVVVVAGPALSNYAVAAEEPCGTVMGVPVGDMGRGR